MNQFTISDLARQDLREIWLAVAEDDPDAASRLVRSLLEPLPKLAAFPGIGRTRDELRPGLRSFPVGKYLLLYLPVPDGIRVYRILHGARDLPRLFE